MNVLTYKGTWEGRMENGGMGWWYSHIFLALWVNDLSEATLARMFGWILIINTVPQASEVTEFKTSFRRGNHAKVLICAWIVFRGLYWDSKENVQWDV